MKYLIGRVYRPELPIGHVLAHNHVKPARICGTRGFRAWSQLLDDRVEVCPCDFAGADLGGLLHYRMKGVPHWRARV
jgi:hypothetical protein